MVLGFNLTFVFSKAVGGWRNMYMVLGAIILVSGVLWLIFARDKKADEVALNKQLNADIEKVSTWDNIKVLFSTKDAWLIFISEFIYIGVIQTYIGFAPSAISTFAGCNSPACGDNYINGQFRLDLRLCNTAWYIRQVRRKKAIYLAFNIG
jgi:ABC-type glycerol-3-phosphate transport system permease component